MSVFVVRRVLRKLLLSTQTISIGDTGYCMFAKVNLKMVQAMHAFELSPRESRPAWACVLNGKSVCACKKKLVMLPMHRLGRSHHIHWDSSCRILWYFYWQLTVFQFLTCLMTYRYQVLLIQTQMGGATSGRHPSQNNSQCIAFLEVAVASILKSPRNHFCVKRSSPEMAVLLKGEGFRIQWHPRGIYTHKPGHRGVQLFWSINQYQPGVIREVVAGKSFLDNSSWFTVCENVQDAAMMGVSSEWESIQCDCLRLLASCSILKKNTSNLQKSAASGCGGDCSYNWVSASENDRCRCPEAMPEKLHLSGHHLKSRLSRPPSKTLGPTHAKQCEEKLSRYSR